jgi:hypothetical protein
MGCFNKNSNFHLATLLQQAQAVSTAGKELLIAEKPQGPTKIWRGKLFVEKAIDNSLFSSGYSETSTDSYARHSYHYSNIHDEYAEPRKQAHIRTLPKQQIWSSPNSSGMSGLYENQAVIESSSSGDRPA